MTFSPVEMLQGLLCLQALLAAGLLLSRRPLWPLAALLVVLALHMLWNLGAVRAWPLPELRPGFSFLYGPLLLAMVRRLAWRDRPALRVWHLLPAILAPVLVMAWPATRSMIWPGVALVTVACLVVGFVELARFERVLKDTHAAYEQQTLGWLRDGLWGLTAAAVADFSRLLLPPDWLELDRWLSTATYVVALALAVLLVWRGWQQPAHFAGLAREDVAAVFDEPVAEPAAETGSGSTDPAARTVPSSLSADQLAGLAAELDAHMAAKQPQLDPELTVTRLAAALGWPVKQLSAVLNQHHGRNFNDFINAARVATACALLADPSRQHDKLIAIQLDAGFASKSVFNAAFKRLTGLTPSQWRQQQAPTADSRTP